MITRAERARWREGPDDDPARDAALALDAADGLREALTKRHVHAPKDSGLFIGPCPNCEPALATYDALVEQEPRDEEKE